MDLTVIRPPVIILGCFLLFTAIQMIFWLGIYARLPFFKSRSGYHQKSPVSVVICARNEAGNLERNLPLVLQQDYPRFEVVVVNDRSSDHTDRILREMKGRYPHLRTTAIHRGKDFVRGKKLALTVGIKAARSEWVLLTDADCRPESDQWLGLMQRSFGRDAGIVLGYGGYERKNSLLNRVIRFDTLFIAMQYFSFALAGRPYMGVGRNLAYRKSLFFRNKGFATHSLLESGDDDLFVSEAATKANTRIEIRSEAHTRSEPETRWRDWTRQKRRHLTTAPRYRGGTRALIGLENTSRMAFYGCFAWLMATTPRPLTVAAVFCGRLVVQLIVLYSVSKRLNEKHLLLISPLLDLMIPVFNALLLIINYVALKRSRWT